MQDQSTIDPAVVARIRKLLNLSKDGAASDNEQEQAASKAQKLMLEHNVSVATVEASNETSTVAKRKKESSKGSAMYEWQQGLMQATAHTNFCFVTVRQSWNGYRYMPKGYDLVGREENVVSTQLLFDYLRSTVERLAQDYVDGDYRRKMSVEAMSFKRGCADRICSRLYERHREALAAQKSAVQSGGNALVPIMEDWAESERCANQDFRDGLPPGTTAHRKFVSARRENAWDAVHEALASDTYRNVDDKAMLDQVARAKIDEAIGAAGLTAEEMHKIHQYVKDSVIDRHIERVEIAAGKRKAPKPSRGGRAYSYRRSYGPRTDYHAERAGESAGRNVSLDRQVGGSASLKRIG